MFKQTGVFSELELQARNEVKWEMYTKKIQIEARVLGDLAVNHIIPVAIRYQSVLTDNVFKLKTLFPNEKGDKLAQLDLDTIERMSAHMATIMEEVKKMVNARKEANKIESEREKAIAYHDNVVPPMDIIRYHIDKLELMVDDECGLCQNTANYCLYDNIICTGNLGNTDSRCLFITISNGNNKTRMRRGPDKAAETARLL